jgi:hypothetical protein
VPGINKIDLKRKEYRYGLILHGSESVQVAECPEHDNASSGSITDEELTGPSADRFLQLKAVKSSRCALYLL